jgi:hypothetical protein
VKFPLDSEHDVAIENAKQARVMCDRFNRLTSSVKMAFDCREKLVYSRLSSKFQTPPRYCIYLEISLRTKTRTIVKLLERTMSASVKFIDQNFELMSKSYQCSSNCWDSGYCKSYTFKVAKKSFKESSWYRYEVHRVLTQREQMSWGYTLK